MNNPIAPLVDTSTLRIFSCGGSPLLAADLRRTLSALGCEMFISYGMTECCGKISMSLLDAEMRREPLETQLQQLCTSGRPFVQMDVRLADERGLIPTPPAGGATSPVGHICIRGPTLFRGYGMLSTSLSTDGFDADGFFDTGDVGFFDGFGYLTVCDRSKDMILVGGENVYSTEVEQVLAEHPSIAQVAVFGGEDRVMGQIVIAAATLRHDAQVTANALKRELVSRCRDRLSNYKVPQHFVFLSALPINASGKVLKRDLAARWASGSLKDEQPLDLDCFSYSVLWDIVAASTPPLPPGRWILFGPAGDGLLVAMAAGLAVPHVVHTLPDLLTALACDEPVHIVFVAPVDSEAEPATVESFLETLQAFTRSPHPGSFTCVTRDAVVVSRNDPPCTPSATTALLRSLLNSCQGESTLTFKLLDVNQLCVSHLGDHVKRLLSSTLPDIAIRSPECFVLAPVLRQVATPVGSQLAGHQSSGGTVVIIGDGVLSALMARFAVEKLGATSLALLSTNSATMQPPAASTVLLAELAIGDPGELALALSAVSQLLGSGLTHLIYCSQPPATPVSDLTASAVARLLRAEFAASSQLADVASLTRSTVLFVSHPSPSAAFSFQSALCHQLCGDSLRACSISAECGLAATDASLVLRALERLLLTNSDLPLVVRVRAGPLSSELSLLTGREPRGDAAPPLDIWSTVTRVVSSALGGLAEDEELDAHAPLMSLGLTSLGAVTVHGELEAALRLSLSSTLCFDYPSLASLVTHLSSLSPNRGGGEPEAAS